MKPKNKDIYFLNVSPLYNLTTVERKFQPSAFNKSNYSSSVKS